VKALAAVLLFALCAAGSIYCYRESIGDGSTLLGIAAALSLFAVWEAVDND
jgi:hypothetical protein